MSSRLFAPVTFILLILFSIFSLTAGAATFTVTTLNDSGPGSLRQAILDANGLSGADFITFQSGLSGTITLTSGSLDITDSLTINGPGASMLAISGNFSSRIFYIHNETGTVTLDGLTLRDGSAFYIGGGIYNYNSTLTVTNSILSNNVVAESELGAVGGGIYNYNGTLTVTNSTLSGNYARQGGGISNSGYGILTVINSTLSGNMSGSSGGGIYNYNGTLTVTNSTLSGNSALQGEGGGISNEDGILTVINSTLSGNMSGNGGGIYNYKNSTLTVNGTTLSGNSAEYNGGGIHNSGGTLTVTNSTLSVNSAGWGGGINNSSGTLTITNSTLSGNRVNHTDGGVGGGIYNGGTALTVINSTVSGNYSDRWGGGIANNGANNSSLAFSNNIVSGNTALYGKEIYLWNGGTIYQQSHNLFGENGVPGLERMTPDASDFIPSGPVRTVIGPLADHGGPTKTHLPVAGSLAIDHGDNTLIPADITTDQRGWSRIAGNAVDIGAVEVASSTPPLTSDSAIGVFRNGQWFLDANANGAWDGCGTEFCFTGFGQAGDMPASGNWDGGSKSYIGVLRSGTGQWFIDRNGNRQWDGCTVDGCYSGFGAPGDLPVAGDWSGTGFAKIGVFRNGQWYLDNGNGQWDGCGTELCLSFGQFGDLPVAGNWNGGLKAGVGVFRAGTWYLDYNGNGQWDGCDVDRCYSGSFGQAGDFPAAGDWNGDGKAKVGVFRAGTWYLDYNGNGAWDGCGIDRCYAGSFGQTGDLPVAGKW